MSFFLRGNLVETTTLPVDEEEVCEVQLTSVEAVNVGDYLLDPMTGRPARVLEVLNESTHGLWVTTQYLGLVATGQQVVRTPDGEWSRLQDLPTCKFVTQSCEGLVSFVLDGAFAATVSGVQCLVHQSTSK